ncbi:MAG: hypothetical protein V4577_29050 [Bacteroidota bacterium]
MAKIIEVNKSTGRRKLDEELTKLQGKKQPMDLSKYFGKINFGEDGLTYQLKIRDEWR